MRAREPPPGFRARAFCCPPLTREEHDEGQTTVPLHPEGRADSGVSCAAREKARFRFGCVGCCLLGLCSGRSLIILFSASRSVRRFSRSYWRSSTESMEYAPRDAATTSAMVSQVRPGGNEAEMYLRSHLWRRGYRFRVQSRKRLGRPDVVSSALKAVVFVDGDFWHGRLLREGGESALRHVVRGPRFEWWRDKLSRNLSRGDLVASEVRRQAWRVIRIWESDFRCDPRRATARVIRELERRRRLVAKRNAWKGDSADPSHSAFKFLFTFLLP